MLGSLLSIAGPLIAGMAGAKGTKSSGSSKSAVDKTTTGSQTDLPPELLSQLSSLFSDILGTGADQTAQAALTKRLGEVGAFDADAFAKAITGQAASAAGINLASTTNAIASKAGGSNTGNSMVALLNNKLQNETAANLAGINANAQLQGEQYKTQGTSDLSAGIAKQIGDIIAATRGASTSGTMNEKGTQKNSGSSSSGGGVGGFLAGLSNGLKSFGGVTN